MNIKSATNKLLILAAVLFGLVIAGAYSQFHHNQIVKRPAGFRRRR